MGSTAPPGHPRSPTQRQGQPDRERQAEATRFRRALTLVGLTVIAPGSAQVMAGNRELGKIVMRIWAGLVVAVALVWWLVSLDTLARLAVRPWLLNTFELLAFAAALGWIALVVDACRLGRPPGLSRRHRLIMLGSTVALAGLVSAPPLMAARYASAAHDAIVAMFPSGEVAAASNGRLNILLLGADAGKGRDGLRPDSITLASVDIRTGRPVLVSLPRNLEKARFPGDAPASREFPNGFSGDGDRSAWMLNATWTYGEEHPDLFAGPAGAGATAVKQAVAGTLGIPVHYYVVVDLKGFENLVDALGGLTVRIDEPIPYGQSGQVLEPGTRKLTGHETLWYARSRTGSNDYARMARQRCVLGAMLNELDPGTVLRHFTALAEASTSVVTTDIPRQQLPELVDLAWAARDMSITSLQLVPPLIVPADPDFGQIRSLVGDAFDESLSGDAESAGGAAKTPAASPAAEDDSDHQRSEPADAAPTEDPDLAEPAVALRDACPFD